VTASIDALIPYAATALTDDAISAHYSAGVAATWLRVNFVSSVDGAATHDGLSGGLGTEADHRVFDILRRLCDVVLVGAGTVRAERYGPMRVDDTASRWRLEHGLADQPVCAIVSGALGLDPASRIFTDAPTRPIVVTIGTSPTERRRALAKVADVIVAGDDQLDVAALVSALSDRGLGRIHCEGGPTLFGTLLAADAVDELCLTVSPLLEAGDARRIARGELPEARALTLAGALTSESALLLRYLVRHEARVGRS
jgi:riboflavin biosynthesis pyrimidine reductase